MGGGDGWWWRGGGTCWAALDARQGGRQWCCRCDALLAASPVLLGGVCMAMRMFIAVPDPSDVAPLQVEASVKRAVQAEAAELQVVWGGTLYHMDDLPFSLGGMPASYGDFRERLRAVAVRWAGGGGVQGWLGRCAARAAACGEFALWCMLPSTGCGPCCLAT